MQETAIRNEAGEAMDFAFHPGERRDTLVILGHGLTGNKDRPLLVALAGGLAERGWPCLRISYSGNGESEGRFEDSCITKEVGDLRAVLATVPQEVRIAYIGHSMGAAVGVLTAAIDLRIRVLVSLAGMTHTEQFVCREFADVVPGQGDMWGEADCPLSEEFVADLTNIGSTLSAAAQVVQPWLLIHAADDDLVPIRDSLEAFAAAAGEKEWLEIPEAGHSFDEASYPQIMEVVDRWLTRYFVRE